MWSIKTYDNYMICGTVDGELLLKMFHCAGVYEDMLVTVSFPCSEIILWNKDTLEKKEK